MRYYFRIALLSITLALLTGGVLLLGPRAAAVALAAQAPNGAEVSIGAAVRISFSRQVDRRSVEERFSISPSLPGSFFWQDQTMTFRPDRPLQPNTDYAVRIAAGLLNGDGQASSSDLGWSFRTRGPRLLALRIAESGGNELWLVAPDGSAPRLLLAVPEGISDFVLAPDGTQAVFVAPRGLDRSVLMLLNLEDGSTRPLVDDTQASAAAPAWSPTGDFIAYERRALTNGVLGVPRIWLTQPDGTLLGPLGTSDGSDISYAPAWSPDGNRIAFLDGISQEIKLYSFFSDGVQTLPVRSGERASWLPDGSALVYSSAELGDAGLSLRIRVATVATPPDVRDLSDGVAAELTPAVAPDGTMVAFTRRAADSPASTIWLVNLDGSAAHALTTAGLHQDTQPVWSPDGTQIALIRSTVGGQLRSDAILVDVATGAERVLLDGAVQVVWAP